MKKILLISALFLSSHAQAFSGSLDMGMSEDTKNEKVKQSFGLEMSQPLFFGLGWWSWSGLGQTFEKSKEAVNFAKTVQGIDWEFRNLRIGASAEFKYEEKFSSEYGVGFSVKLW